MSLLCQSPVAPSRAIRIIRPTYPALAIPSKVAGRISWIPVGNEGLVENLELRKGHPVLIQAATEARSQGKSRPMVLNRKALEMESRVNVDFRVTKNQRQDHEPVDQNLQN